MSLKEWLENAWVTGHRTSPEEIASLLQLAVEDLTQCRINQLSAGWRLSIAYNAALQIATAALAASGYRPARGHHHQRVIESLRYTAGTDDDSVSLLQRFRRKRHAFVYDRPTDPSEKEAANMVDVAGDLLRQVVKWLREEHPDLLDADSATFLGRFLEPAEIFEEVVKDLKRRGKL
jgi:hypothetical protein